VSGAASDVRNKVSGALHEAEAAIEEDERTRVGLYTGEGCGARGRCGGWEWGPLLKCGVWVTGGSCCRPCHSAIQPVGVVKVHLVLPGHLRRQ
jgi:hypothetical protein